MPVVAVPGKRELHELVDKLPPEQIGAALQYLSYLSADPALLSLLCAPADDEAYTEAQRREDAEADAAISRGEGISQEELLRDLGL